ncbi:MAG: SMC-Scp complex subunit ScpB [Bacillota bacterium]
MWTKMGVLFSDDIKAAIECLLFVANEPLSVEKIAEIVEISPKDVQILLEEIRQYDQGRGFELVEIGGGWQMCTRPELSGFVEKLYRPKVDTLSKAALETLAIVAYRQPVTRAEIEGIRGVKIDGVLSTLLEKNLVREVGRKSTPGKPILYGTTVEFLRYFGLNTLEELPSPDDLATGT